MIEGQLSNYGRGATVISCLGLVLELDRLVYRIEMGKILGSLTLGIT